MFTFVYKPDEYDTNDLKLYQSENIRAYAPADHCLFCDECEDFFYDAHGIYLFLCNKSMNYPECRNND